MKEQLIKIILFVVINFIAKDFGTGILFIAQGIMVIFFWGTWLNQDKSKTFSKWNDFLNYIGLMCIITGVGRFLS